MTITVILEEGTQNWGAFTPDEIGSVIATGPTREATIERFRSALKAHVDEMRRRGQDVPDVTELAIYEASEKIPASA